MRVAVFWDIRAWETREIVPFQCRSSAVPVPFRKGEVVLHGGRRSGIKE
jgi:hypothetical protein